MRSLKDYGLFLLSRREYSREELRARLLKKEYPKDEVDALMVTFVENHWLDDQRFAEIYCRSKVLEGKSRKQLEYSLRKKGIDGDLCKSVLSEFYSKEAEILAIEKQIRKYQRSSKAPDRNKMISRLAAKGFNVGQIIKCIDTTIE